MLTEVILVLITLASTVVGTVLNPRPWVKACIIALACASMFAAIIKIHNDNLNNEFIKTALRIQLATSKPTPAFQRALDQSIDRVANKRGLQLNRSVQKEQGSVYFFARQQTEKPLGVIYLRLEDNGEAFISFVERRHIDPIIESAMLTLPDMKDEGNVQRFLDDLAFIGEIAIDDNIPWMTEKTTIKTETHLHPFGVTVSAEEGDNRVSVNISNDFIDTIVTQPPIERNWRAYKEFQRQLNLINMKK